MKSFARTLQKLLANLIEQYCEYDRYGESRNQAHETHSQRITHNDHKAVICEQLNKMIKSYPFLIKEILFPA